MYFYQSESFLNFLIFEYKFFDLVQRMYNYLRCYLSQNNKYDYFITIQFLKPNVIKLKSFLDWTMYTVGMIVLAFSNLKQEDFFTSFGFRSFSTYFLNYFKQFCYEQLLNP